MKKKILFNLGILGIMAAAAGCGKTADVVVEDETVAAADTVETASTDGYDLVYATVNLPYADFYYGELNNVEPQYDAKSGDYEALDLADEAGYNEDGMYDAVSSATTQKSTRFESSYFEETENGVDILGVSGVNVAISRELYEDVLNAIENNTACKNPLIDIVSSMEVTEDTPVEYKVINADGTLSKTIGNTVVSDNITASITTISSYGNYQIDFEGLELDSAVMQGAVIETSDGALYGLEHEENLWLNTSEIAFAAAPFTESHGNEVSYKRFEDLQGKTITKITYLVANADDIEINTNLYCNLLLGDEYKIEGDSEVLYSNEGTDISAVLTVPEDSSYDLTLIKFGRSAVDLDGVSYSDSTITLPSSFLPGSYTLCFEDETYSALTLSVLINSGLSEDAVSFDGKTIVLDSDDFSGSDYISNISTVLIDGEKVNGKGLSSILFSDETGEINLEAQTGDGDSKTDLFPTGGTYEVTLEATGYPSVTFTVER